MPPKRERKREEEDRTGAFVTAGLGILACAAGIACIPLSGGTSATFIGVLVGATFAGVVVPAISKLRQ